MRLRRQTGVTCGEKALRESPTSDWICPGSATCSISAGGSLADLAGGGSQGQSLLTKLSEGMCLRALGTSHKVCELDSSVDRVAPCNLGRPVGLELHVHRLSFVIKGNPIAYMARSGTKPGAAQVMVFSLQ